MFRWAAPTPNRAPLKGNRAKALKGCHGRSWIRRALDGTQGIESTRGRSWLSKALDDTQGRSRPLQAIQEQRTVHPSRRMRTPLAGGGEASGHGARCASIGRRVVGSSFHSKRRSSDRDAACAELRCEAPRVGDQTALRRHTPRQHPDGTRKAFGRHCDGTQAALRRHPDGAHLQCSACTPRM